MDETKVKVLVLKNDKVLVGKLIEISPENVNCGPITKLKCEYLVSSKIQSGKLYWFGITALDEAGNEYEQVFVKPFVIP